MTAGRVPSAAYGAEVFGVDDNLLVSLQRTAASCVPPCSKRRDLLVALALQNINVIAAVTAPPLVRWAKEAWAASAPFAGPHFSIMQMRQWWEGFHWAGVTEWRHVAGPLGALYMSAARLGWSLLGQFLWQDDRGVVLPLADMSPAMMTWHVTQSSERLVERRIADSLGHASYTGHRANIRLLRSVLRSKKSEHSLCRYEKAALTAAAANAVWTNKRLHEKKLVESPLCDRCGSHEDSVFHRVWECQHCDAVSARAVFASPALVAAACDAGDGHPLYTRGIGLVKFRAERSSNVDQMEFRRDGVIVSDQRL